MEASKDLMLQILDESLTVPGSAAARPLDTLYGEDQSSLIFGKYFITRLSILFHQIGLNMVNDQQSVGELMGLIFGMTSAQHVIDELKLVGVYVSVTRSVIQKSIKLFIIKSEPNGVQTIHHLQVIGS